MKSLAKKMHVDWSRATSFFVWNQYFLFTHDFAREYRFDNYEDLMKYEM